MTENEFVELLYRGESESLDFKSEQYVFVGASEEAKAELLKDILAFANAWRNDPAYILIGVQETPSRKANATGISPADHIDDATLQQFVNGKTKTLKCLFSIGSKLSGLGKYGSDLYFLRSLFRTAKEI